jgi:CheY-like chemotaxis protein
VKNNLAQREFKVAKRIMIVDDSASIRQLLGFTLKGAGYDVIEADDDIDNGSLR